MHDRGENIAPATHRILHGRDHRLGHGGRLGKLGHLGRATVAYDKDVAEVVAGHEVQLAASPQVGEGNTDALAPLGPPLVPAPDLLLAAKHRRNPRRIALAGGQPRQAQFAGGELRLLLAPAVEVDAHVAERIRGKNIRKSVVVQIARRHRNGHGCFGDTPAGVEHGEKAAEAGKETILVHARPEIRGLQRALEATVADGVLGNGRRGRLRQSQCGRE